MKTGISAEVLLVSKELSSAGSPLACTPSDGDGAARAAAAGAARGVALVGDRGQRHVRHSRRQQEAGDAGVVVALLVGELGVDVHDVELRLRAGVSRLG